MNRTRRCMTLFQLHRITSRVMPQQAWTVDPKLR
jgi:hypothetical protein